MDRLHEIEVFVAVADAGSFTKAGTRLRLSPPAVTRAISALEDRLGARVFNRTTRSLTITEVGQRFLEDARRILSDIDTAEKEAVGETAMPHGHLAITASVTFGRAALAPVVCSFLGQHPRVSASVLLLDRVVNLVEEGIDIAIRIGHLPDSNLIAKRIGEVRQILVASPNYLARRGTPDSPSDLRLHSVIAFTGLMPNREWHFLNGQKPGSVTLRPALEVNDALASIQAAEMGHGITTTLSYMVSDRIRDGKLTTVLDTFTLPPQPVHLVYPHARLVAPKIRAFIDFAAPRLKTTLDQLT
ncbi:MAG: LysR family transcriptional regulator [Afipia sp.]|uniref:LysR family transcriptional regulator n=1 Tax=Parvibaculum sp. TaxID=2024848 RepID=UPI002731CC04|nr:LysR family transcriptional regulator [Parvibaculum sp.]MDP2149561.1 LysR family transcriptional regulator [Parvibaculum sp.]MDZ4365997.1 LysR family transcriptional regulator [Afipia sp.]